MRVSNVKITSEYHSIPGAPLIEVIASLTADPMGHDEDFGWKDKHPARLDVNAQILEMASALIERVVNDVLSLKEEASK